MTSRESLPSWSGKGFLLPHPFFLFFKTDMGWTLAAKIWSSNTRSASVRVWTFTSLQPLLAGSHLFPQIKAQKKMKWTIRARGLTSSLLDLCLSVSGGTSSASVFPFPFGCFLCTESQNASLCRELFPMPSGRVHNTRGNGAMCQKEKDSLLDPFYGGKKRVQENHFVQLTREELR